AVNGAQQHDHAHCMLASQSDQVLDRVERRGSSCDNHIKTVGVNKTLNLASISTKLDLQHLWQRFKHCKHASALHLRVHRNEHPKPSLMWCRNHRGRAAIDLSPGIDDVHATLLET